MNLCFKAFLERVCPALGESNTYLDWTSVFIRSDSTEHIIRADAKVKVAGLEFPDKRDYSENLKVMAMNTRQEVVTSAYAKRSLAKPCVIVVNTVIDTRIPL